MRLARGSSSRPVRRLRPRASPGCRSRSGKCGGISRIAVPARQPVLPRETFRGTYRGPCSAVPRIKVRASPLPCTAGRLESRAAPGRRPSTALYQHVMRVLHLAAGNRWTGAAAPAFAEVEALRAAGVDAHYAYVGGYKLQTKLARHDFAHPIIDKAQNPVSFLRTADALNRLVGDHRFDIVHAHLTWDHWLARFVARGRRSVRIARTFHSRRT